MLKISFLLLLTLTLICFTNSYAQYISPESVTYDSVSLRYFISNTGSGKVVQRNQAGVVTDFVTVGGTLRGITVHNGVLYAASSNSVKGYDLATGNPTSLNLTMGTSLNGIKADTNGFLYVSNFSNTAGQRTIYKINTANNQFWAYAQVPRHPNGVYVDYKRNRLLVVAWGVSATVMAVSLTDSTNVTTLVTTPYSNLDGISLDRNDHVYCSAYSAGVIFRYDINFAFAPAVVVNSGLTMPADIYVNRITDTLAIPNAGSNSVSFIPLSVPTGIQNTNTIADDFRLSQNYPNPFNPTTNINFDIKAKGMVTLKVFDILGNEVATLVNEELNTGGYNITFDAASYTSGVYFYELRAGEFRDVKKMLLVK
jgi:hypothetical protein